MTSLFWQRERELYEEQMIGLKKKNDMKTPEIPRKETTQQLDTENERKQDELELGAAALKEGRGNTQVLCAPLAKCKNAKEALKKHLAFLKGKSHPQVGTGIDLQSTAMSLSDSNAVSHEEVGF